MKVTVIKDSVIYQQTIYKEGQSFDCDDAIATSLLERGYVSVKGGEETAKALADAGIETLDVPFNREQLEEMDRTELIALAKDLGLKASGKNSEIIERIVEFHEIEEIENNDEELGEMPDTGMPEE